MKGTSDPAWGKHPEENHKLSLVDHSADVAAVVEALLQNTLMGRRLARLGGLHELPEMWIARLGYLAALHDFGKAGVRFQRKVLKCVKEKAGHEAEALTLIDPDSPYALAQRFQALIPDEVWSWVDNPTFKRLLTATICHHGRPRKADSFPDRLDWTPRHGIDPFATLASLFDAAQRWFPKALEEGPLFPTTPAFQHGWNGVLNLADWLASNEAFFPFEDHQPNLRISWARDQAEELLKDLHLDVQKARVFLGGKAPDWCSFAPEGTTARPTQQLVSKLPLPEEGSLTILEASTGSGKTEAAVWHFARLFQAGLVDGMTFALPTRTAATQIEERLQEALERFISDKDARPQVVLAVPGYLRVDGVEGRRGEGFHVQWDDDDPMFLRGAWAAENSKRFLAGAVVVGTIDQVLLSALQVRSAHMRASCLLRHLLVVDEVHASDAYMTRVLEQVLKHHEQSGGHTLLMSATLGAGARHRFLNGNYCTPSLEEAEALPYPLICHRGGPGSQVMKQTVDPNALPEDKQVKIEPARLLAAPKAIAEKALDAAEAGARVLVVRNTVTGCREVQKALVELATERNRRDLLFGVPHSAKTGGQKVPCPHHGRFAPVDRRLLDVAIQAAFHPHSNLGGGLVAVATQTVEQSLDLDADLLITDLCPMDVLIQRLGRLHRHADTPRPEGFETPRANILMPKSRDLLEKIDANGSAEPEHGLGGYVYPDLRIIDRSWRQLEEHAELRLPSMARQLVERSTHPNVLENLDQQDPRWKEHCKQQLGKKTAEAGAGAAAVVDWQRNYGEQSFGGKDGPRVPTRLGAQDLLLKLTNRPMGPFGVPVPETKIPAWFFEEAIPNEILKTPEVATVQPLDGGGFVFQVGGLDLLYDALGLNKETKN